MGSLEISGADVRVDVDAAPISSDVLPKGSTSFDRPSGIATAHEDVDIDLPHRPPSSDVLPEGSTSFVRPQGIATAHENVDQNIVHTAPGTEILPEGSTSFVRPQGIATAHEDVDQNLTHTAPKADVLPEGDESHVRPVGIATAHEDVDVDLPNRRRGPGGIGTTATVLTFVPGSSGEAYPDLVDDWFHAAGTTTQDDDLAEAVKQERNITGYARAFRRYRLRNSVEVTFDSFDGRSVEDGTDGVTVVPTDHDASPVTLPRGSVLRRHFGGLFAESDAITEPLDYQTPPLFGPYVASELVDVGGVQGVRAVVVTGCTNPYLAAIGEFVRDHSPAAFFTSVGLSADALVGDYVLENPLLYSVLELVVFADESRIVTLRDASRFPKHALYLGDAKHGSTTVETSSGWGSEDSATVRFADWVADGSSPVAAPRRGGSSLAYERTLVDDLESEGEDSSLLSHVEPGDELDVETLVDASFRPLVPTFDDP